MAPLRSRLRALSALVVLCLSIGPAASALCPHADEPPPAHEMPAPETGDVPPCHDVPAPDVPDGDDADCASPCCLTAMAPAPATPDTPTADVHDALAAQSTDASPAATQAARAAVPPRAPPRHVLEKSVRLRV